MGTVDRNGIKSSERHTSLFVFTQFLVLIVKKSTPENSQKHNNECCHFVPSISDIVKRPPCVAKVSNTPQTKLFLKFKAKMYVFCMNIDRTAKSTMQTKISCTFPTFSGQLASSVQFPFNHTTTDKSNAQTGLLNQTTESKSNAHTGLLEPDHRKPFNLLSEKDTVNVYKSP